MKIKMSVYKRYKSKLLVVEGIDGSGKTTFCKILYSHLCSQGIDVILSEEPTNGPYGKQIKKLLAQNFLSVSNDELIELFLKDRKWHIEHVILPALSKGQIVLLDRYYLSTVAYQGAIEGGDPEKIYLMHKKIVIDPDLVIFIDVDPEVALQRITKRNKTQSFFETKEFLKKEREIYLKFLPRFKYISVLNYYSPACLKDAVKSICLFEILPVLKA